MMVEQAAMFRGPFLTSLTPTLRSIVYFTQMTGVTGTLDSIYFVGLSSSYIAAVN